MQVENQECSPSSNAVHGGPRARGWGNQERHQPHLHNMIFEKKPISPILEASSPFPLESNCFRNHPTHMVKKKKKFARFLIGEYYYSFTESKLFVCFKKIFFMGYSYVDIPVPWHCLASIHTCFAYFVSWSWLCSSIHLSIGFAETSFFLSW